MAAPAAIPYLIMAGAKIYKVANNPATRKWARSLMKKRLQKKFMIFFMKTNYEN